MICEDVSPELEERGGGGGGQKGNEDGNYWGVVKMRLNVLDGASVI